MTRRVLPLFLILIFGTLFALLLLNPAPTQTGGELEQLPALNLRTQSGETIRLPIAGRPVIVNVFASWCVPCAAEMPQLAKLQGSRIAIYGIAYKDQLEPLATFLQRYGNPFTEVALDDGIAATQLGITGVPESWLVDAQGHVQRHMAGALDDAQLADWQTEIASWR